MRRDALGAWGEERACELLKKNGLKIVERNYRCPSGEVDIIARDSKTLVFVEVKTRASEDYGEPSRAVDRAKQRHILRTALRSRGDSIRRAAPCPVDDALQTRKSVL